MGKNSPNLKITHFYGANGIVNFIMLLDFTTKNTYIQGKLRGLI
jgi:hypothetical protein